MISCLVTCVQISQWQGDKWEQVGSNVCGRSAPDELETKTNQFRVVFRTNNAITGDGFKVCSLLSQISIGWLLNTD